MTTPTTLKVGFVPEHFSTPLLFAQSLSYWRDLNLEVKLQPFPSGTGHMILALESGEIDIAIGLTEGFIAGLGKGQDWFRIVGRYVDTPLCWAISAGKETDIKSVEQLKGGNLGVSRIGSGSYVMGFVLAEQEGWLGSGNEEAEGEKKEEPFEFVVLNDFKGLRDGVNNGTADAFMWELFTSKKFYSTNEIRQIGHIYTPWPSWHVVASTSLLSSPSGTAAVSSFLEGVNKGIAHFNANPQEAVTTIAESKIMEYSKADAEEWMKTVKFAEDATKVDLEVVQKTIYLLKKAGVIKRDISPEEMVVKV